MNTTLAPLLRHLRRLAAPHTLDPDAALLDRFARSHDEAAFSEIMARHGPMVWRVCRRVLLDAGAAEDAFQATFLVLTRRARDIRQPSRLAGWLYGVALRVARKARGAGYRDRLRQAPANGLEPAASGRDPAGEASYRELLDALDQEMECLSEVYRLPVLLCALEGLSQEEAAARLGWTAGSVKGRLERGRKQLHARLTKRGLTLGAALAAAEAARASAGAVAIPLTCATARTALVAGGGTTGVSVGVLALADSAEAGAVLMKPKLIAVLLLVTCLASGAAWWAGLTTRQEQPGDHELPALAVAAQKEHPVKAEELVPDRPDPTPAPAKEPPAEVITAWKKAGAIYGTLKIFVAAGVDLRFEPRGQLAAGEVPAFSFPVAPAQGFANLPMIDVPFELVVGFSQNLEELARFKQLRTLSLRYGKMRNADLKQLAGLTQLQALHVTPVGSDREVTDAGLKELAGLTQLQTLSLDSWFLTDAGLKELAPFKNLRTLNLNANLVTDAGVKELAAFKQLHTLYLSNTKVRDAGMKELGKLKQLQTLSLMAGLRTQNGGYSVTHAGLKELASLKQLQTLDLSYTEVTDLSLKVLAGLKQLQTLDLSYTKVTGEGLKELAGLKELKSLNLGKTGLSNAGLKELATLQQLQALNLHEAHVSNADLKELAALKQLKTLILYSTPVTDPGLKELAEFRQLKTLWVGGHLGVTDVGVKELAGLTQLETLILHRTATTDAGLKELAGLTQLRKLDLGNTIVTDAGLKHLSRMTQLETLDLGAPKITDAGLTELYGLQRLQTLGLQNTKVTAAGIQQLRKKLPGLQDPPGR